MWNDFKLACVTRYDTTTNEDVWVIENTLVYASPKEKVATIRVLLYPKKESGNLSKLLIRFVRVRFPSTPIREDELLILDEYYEPLSKYERVLGSDTWSVRTIPHLQLEWVELLNEADPSNLKDMKLHIIQVQGIKKLIFDETRWKAASVSPLYTENTEWVYKMNLPHIEPFIRETREYGSSRGTIVLYPDKNPSLPYLTREIYFTYTVEDGIGNIAYMREHWYREDPIELLCGSAEWRLLKEVPQLLQKFKEVCNSENLKQADAWAYCTPDDKIYPSNLFASYWEKENRMPKKVICEADFAEEAAGLLYAMAPGQRPRNSERIMNQALDSFRAISKKAKSRDQWRIYDKKEFLPTLHRIFFDIPEFVALYLSKEDIASGRTIKDLEEGFDRFQVDYCEEFQFLDLNAYLHELASRLWPNYDREDD